MPLVIERVQNLRRALGMLEPLGSLPLELERLRLQIGRAEAARVATLPADAPLADAEFQVFSQFGEDGIIQHLVSKVPVANDVFVEFGVEDYTESNTRFLLVNNNWRGLVLDGSDAHKRWLESHPTRLAPRDRGRDGLHRPRQHQRTDTRRRGRGRHRDPLDRPGRERPVDPRGDRRGLAADPDPGVQRDVRPRGGRDGSLRPVVRARPETSVEPLLGRVAGRAHAGGPDKGFALVGSNSAGNNAFYVRDDVRGELPALDAAEAWRPSRFRESRGPAGELTYVSDRMERLRLMREMPVHDVESNRTMTIAERFGV